MLIKKVMLLMVLSFGFSGLAGSEALDLSTSAKTKKQSGLNTNQAAQSQSSPQSSVPEKNNRSISNEKSNAEKKSSMVDYCRKHTC
ncbi:hypothetical protein [Nitrosomonas sp.]|uniref:hypothetical protein n=1 Tax=Nitrosomonas sp. TaxID=42353 RepID=UPI002081BFEF|nr:hypothetical protein [Nitrosomonas sp.]GJL75937.1 MAG: hypothetical protein NMNS02_20430 [Nitrosomonas sp.]